MARLRRFENHRYIGTRDDMVVYDCDVPAQFDALSGRLNEEELMDRDLLQAFAPDEVPEARNRGFHLPR
jgi:hypothetical protein